MTTKRCPCGSALVYANCCGPYIAGKKLPPTPLALMKSRYTAYTELNLGYIVDTMMGKALDDFDFISAQKWASLVTWVSLEILSHDETGSIGQVEFKVTYKEGPFVQVLQEKSNFEKQDGRWIYTGEAE